MNDFLFERGRLLENQFYREKDRHLLDRLRAEMQAEALGQCTRLHHLWAAMAGTDFLPLEGLQRAYLDSRSTCA